MCKAIFVFFISDIVIAKECASQCHAMIFLKVPIKFHCNLWTSLGNQLQVLLKWLKLFNVPCSCSCCTCYDFCLCNCNLTNLTKCLHAQLGLVPWPAFPFSFFVCQQAALDWVGTAHTCYSCVCVSECVVCGLHAAVACCLYMTLIK